MDGSLWQVHVHRCCHNPFVILLDMVASTAAGSEENYLNDDCGCLLHTYSLRTWFLGLGFLMAETLLVVDTCPCGVVLFARSNEKCTHQSVEFIKEWDFHRSLIYETANRLLWPRLREMRGTYSHSE